MYCGIGHCYECRVTVDGVEDVRSCLIRVRDGMQVLLQRFET
jgi:sarcosine oxidase subunit alpha